MNALFLYRRLRWRCLENLSGTLAPLARVTNAVPACLWIKRDDGIETWCQDDGVWETVFSGPVAVATLHVATMVTLDAPGIARKLKFHIFRAAPLDGLHAEVDCFLFACMTFDHGRCVVPERRCPPRDKVPFVCFAPLIHALP